MATERAWDPAGDGPRDGSGTWLTIAEAARALGVSPKAIRNRIARGTLPWRPRGNEGREVLIGPGDLSPAEHAGLSLNGAAGTVSGPSPDVAIRLLDELAEARAAGETWRDRAHELELELARAGTEAAAALAVARERAAGAEGEVRALRDALADLAGRLDRAEALLARPWWRRLFG